MIKIESIIVDFFGETEQDFVETVEFIQRNKKYINYNFNDIIIGILMI